ncbi:hypothetical protein ONE63_008494 [Megalurothrips usitatus]|uniref:Chitin-binding type-2 domain-containing protein n=1 Tax=Megalurothrips usitatus TaxID=439358 RepID=A0AAV7XLC6_9NEOP|nr:hypothetical protein ONE63_008494 [Megalurothrips usitatus]
MDRFLLRVLMSMMVVAFATAAPRIRAARDTGAALRLGLPSNATSIRSSEMLSERFSCAGRHYGYYADPDNDCQLFHVCLPVQFDDGRGAMYKWSFVCPEDTVFNQETFTCSRREDAISCQDSERFYGLNEDLGVSRRQQQAQHAQDAEEEEEVEAEQQHLQQHGMDRPMEVRPQSDSVVPVPAQASAPVATDASDDTVSKYGAFTTIRY